MLDRRQLMIGGLAGLLSPGLVEAQQGGARPPGVGGGATTGGGINNAGNAQNLPGGESGNLGSRLSGREATQGGSQQMQMPNPQTPQPPRISALILSQSYQGTPGLTLANTTRDGALIARSFQRLRFNSVMVQTDGTPAETMQHIAAFLGTVDANTIALLYLAGHGVEIGGENLFLLEGASSFLSLQGLVQLLQQRAGVTVLFLDACRNNPFGNVAAALSGRRLSRAIFVQEGSAVRIQTVSLDELRAAPAETIGRLRAFNLQGSQIKIVFSTDPANVAFDGARPNSRNSPFAEALARHIGAPMSLDDIVALTTGDVVRATRRMQSPWSQGSIDRPIFLSGRGRRVQTPYR